MGEIKQINIKNRIYYFYNDIFDIKNFHARLLKIEKKKKKKKNHTKTLIFTTLDTSKLKKMMIINVFIV